MEEEQKKAKTAESSSPDASENEAFREENNKETEKEVEKKEKKKPVRKKKKKGAWKKEFTTVTPVSKLLTFALFIILPFVAFMLGTQLSHLTDVYGFLDSSKGGAQVASTTQKIIKETKVVDTLTFVERNNEFEFTYPVEWGALEYIYKPVFFSEEDIDNPEYDDIDFDEVQTERWYLHFVEIPCTKEKVCFTSMQMYTYDKDYPLKLLCEKDECWTEDFKEDKEFVEESQDFESNGLYWYCEAGMYTNNSMTGLSCRTYTDKAVVQVNTGYEVSDLDEVTEVCSENLSDVQCVKEFVDDEKDFITFNKGLSIILESFKETE